MVSSDEEEILLIAKHLGALPVHRSERAASDISPASDVIFDLLTQVNLATEITDETLIVYLQPTSPLRTSKHVLEALELYRSNRCPVVSVTNISEYPQKMLEIDNAGFLKSFIANSDPSINRQALPNLLIPNGAIYIFKVSDFKEFDAIPVQSSIPHFMSREDSIDIDSQLDLSFARWLFKIRNS